MSTSDLIQPRHLTRRAVIYVRQSSPHQVLTNTESQRLQYAMTRRAREPPDPSMMKISLCRR